jgi:hypothetical protein
MRFRNYSPGLSRHVNGSWVNRRESNRRIVSSSSSLSLCSGVHGAKTICVNWDLADRALAYWPGSTLVDVGGRAAEYPDGTSAGPHLQKQDEGGVPPKLWNG